MVVRGLEAGHSQAPPGLLPGDDFFLKQVCGLGEGIAPTTATRKIQGLTLVGFGGKGHSLYVGVASGMAQNHGEPQRNKLVDKAGVIVVQIDLAQFAPMAQDQETQAMQLINRKAQNVGIVQNIGAVFVVIGV